MIARWVCFFQLPTVLPTLSCIRLVEWRSPIPLGPTHIFPAKVDQQLAVPVSLQINSLLLSLLSPGRKGIQRLTHNVLLQQGRGRNLAPLCALLTPRDGKMPTSTAFPHLILPCWCQMHAEAQLSASVTGSGDREAECWLLCLSAPYSASLMQGGLEALYWDPLTGYVWEAAVRSAASPRFHCFIWPLCCQYGGLVPHWTSLTWEMEGMWSMYFYQRVLLCLDSLVQGWMEAHIPIGLADTTLFGELKHSLLLQ